MLQVQRKIKSLELVTQRLPFFCGLLIATVIALLPISVAAQCATGWDANGEWMFYQRGQANPIYLTLEHKGNVVHGRAVHEIHKPNWSTHTQGGLVDGTLVGDRFSIQIFWPPHYESGIRLVGVYNAKILPSGRLDGNAYEKMSPGVLHLWFSGGALKCKPPPPVIPKPIKSSGKAKVKPAPPPAETKSQPAPPPMKVPGIIAGPVIFSNASAFTTISAIQWDGGPDHPYAEVWLKVNNGEATFLVEQGKGGRQITVERGKVYEYILTDAGKTLATVVVVGR